jgi:conjugal transfer pilus assembly protein TraW
VVNKTLTIACSLLKLAILVTAIKSTAALASQTPSRVIGAVYPIIERDALMAIKEKARQVDWQQAMKHYTNSWQHRQQSPLPAAKFNQTRFHRPVHKLEKAIVDQHGTIIYPQGFDFNPLSFMKMPFRIVVVAFDQLAWFKPRIKSTDRVLLTQGDVFKAREILGKTVFLLDEKTRDKLNVTAVPTIISQKGPLFELQEIKKETQ